MTIVSPQASPTAVNRRNSSATKHMIASLSFAIFNIPEFEDMGGIVEDLVTQDPTLMRLLEDDISNLEASLQLLRSTNQKAVVVTFQSPETARDFRLALEPLLRNTQYTFGDANPPSSGTAVRSLTLGDQEAESSGTNRQKIGDTSPTPPPVHNNTATRLLAFSTRMLHNHCVTCENPTDIPNGGGCNTSPGTETPLYGGAPETAAADTDKGKDAVELVAAAAILGKGKEVVANIGADPLEGDNARKRKVNDNSQLARHAKLMEAFSRPPADAVETEPDIPPPLLPSPEIYEAYKELYDQARALCKAVMDRSTKRGLFCLNLRAPGPAKFAPFHFSAGCLLDTNPVGLYIHTPTPNTDPTAPAWNWQIHVVKLYFKTEQDANNAYEMVNKRNAQLKANMPAIREWEITDPLGNPIPNPNATKAQQEQGSPWIMTLRTPFLVPWGKH
jgi:hypothetical protein